jgi:GNAT superfamily N-acetyltransferase
MAFPFGKRYLDVRFRASRRARVRVMERPGRWLEPAERQRLLEEMRALVRRSIPGETLDYGVLTGDAERWDAAILTLIHDAESGALIAFNALAILRCELRGQPREVIHLGLVLVDPGARAQGLSWVLYGLTTMLLFARRRLQPLWVSNVTQVPAIFGMVAESFADVFPSPLPGSRRSFDHLQLARAIMARHRHVFGVGPEAGFDEERFVITDSYTGGSDHLKKSFAEATPHRREVYNDACRRELDYGRGDDFLQLGQVNLRASQAYLLKEVPRGSLAGVGLQLAFLFLSSLVVPVLRWLTPSEPTEELRAWS